MTSQLLDPRHQSVANMIGHALTLHEDVDIWRDLSFVLGVRLKPYERACLGFAALDAVEDGQLFDIIDAVVQPRLIGSPLPVLLDFEADARWWADLATPSELRAWLAACFARLPKQHQSAFLASANRRAAA